MEFNLPYAQARLARLAQALGEKVETLSQAEAAQAAIDAVRWLAQDVGIPARLSDLGVMAEAIPQMAADAMKSGNIAVNPRPTALEDVIALYQRAL